MSMILSKSQRLSEIRKHYKFKSDAEFARFLDIKPTTLSSWHSRDTYDFELLYSKCVELNPDWLLTGRGEMLNQGNILDFEFLKDKSDPLKLLQWECRNLEQKLADKEEIIQLQGKYITKLEQELETLKEPQKS